MQQLSVITNMFKIIITISTIKIYCYWSSKQQANTDVRRSDVTVKGWQNGRTAQAVRIALWGKLIEGQNIFAPHE